MECVFTLSTGRCGTMTLANLLDQSPALKALHEPLPRLIRESGDAYQAPEAGVNRLIARVARQDYVEEISRQGMTYVETANRLTFFAPAIAKVFPRSRFIHLVREPAAMVRSGARRGWYAGHPWDQGRIVPRSDETMERPWSDLSPVEKVAWNWVATNRFALDFFETLPPERRLSVRLEDLEGSVPELCEFLGIPRFAPRLGVHNAGQRNAVDESFVPFLEAIGAEVIERCGYQLAEVQEVRAS